MSLSAHVSLTRRYGLCRSQICLLLMAGRFETDPRQQMGLRPTLLTFENHGKQDSVWQFRLEKVSFYMQAGQKYKLYGPNRPMEILQIINSLKSKKTLGSDRISTHET